MISGCPNNSCSFYNKNNFIKKDGLYYRKEDSRKIQRFQCTHCYKKFSAATSKLEYRQKKRRINIKLFELLSSGVSMRRSARLLRINKTTVHRKLIYLAKKSRLKHADFLFQLRNNPVTHMQFDDLISSVHTKLKPVTIAIAVDVTTRKILGAEVGTIPAFGTLAELSRKKYGTRKNEHEEKLGNLFHKIQKSVKLDALIESDEHKRYEKMVYQFFPTNNYFQFKGEKGCVAGQGELKKIKYDPLFNINHTCALFRANINRLIRKTWCTSKRIDMLQNHIDIFINYHNSNL